MSIIHHLIPRPNADNYTTDTEIDSSPTPSFPSFNNFTVHTCSCWTWQYFFVLWKPRIILSLTKPEIYADQSYDLDPDPADDTYLAYELVDFPLAASDLNY